jgi:hypothetical protein
VRRIEKEDTGGGSHCVQVSAVQRERLNNERSTRGAACTLTNLAGTIKLAKDYGLVAQRRKLNQIEGLV